MKRLIKDIIIHCAATPNGKPFTIADIDSMHKARGFKRDSQAVRNLNSNLRHVGYHFVITTEGHIETGRGLEEIGAHVQGNNSKSIGICMIGTDKYTPAQWEALRTCVINLSTIIQGRPHATAEGALNAYKDMGISIRGHRDFSPDLNGDGQITRNEWLKTCPGFSVTDWIKGGMVQMKASVL
jgi:N-acetyl-anhydromuramyl-L-alanine amidase AmpD